MTVRTHRIRTAAFAALALTTVCLAHPVAAQAAKRAAKPASAEAAGIAAGGARALQQRTLHLLDGGLLTMSSLRGQVVVVNFWATWCRPCRKELPALEAMNTELSRRGGRVIAVSIDEDPQNVRRFAREHALSLPIALDGPDGLARELNLPAVPYTLVLDRSGAVAMASAGSDPVALAAVAARARELSAATPMATQEGGSR